MAMPSNIHARHFYRVAVRRLNEARLIFDKLQLSAAAQYLGGYGVECMLKSLLLARPRAGERKRSRDETVAWLKAEFGHNLNKLRKEAARRGAILPPAEALEFVFVSTWDPQSTYDAGAGDVKEAERFLSAAAKIVKWADESMTKG
jgi:hypothetical protein